MLCKIAKLILSFHIVGLKEVLRQIIGVDAQTACQVYKSLPLQQAGFICCTRLRRALFDGKMCRKKQIFVSGPFWNFFCNNCRAAICLRANETSMPTGAFFKASVGTSAFRFSLMNCRVISFKFKSSSDSQPRGR